MSVISTCVKGWRWPFFFLYRVLGLYLKTITFSAFPCSKTLPVTFALSINGVPIFISLFFSNNKTSENSTGCPFSISNFSILILSPGEKMYCLITVLIIDKINFNLVFLLLKVLYFCCFL